jgi:hypothetical protein
MVYECLTENLEMNCWHFRGLPQVLRIIQKGAGAEVMQDMLQARTKHKPTKFHF